MNIQFKEKKVLKQFTLYSVTTFSKDDQICASIQNNDCDLQIWNIKDKHQSSILKGHLRLVTTIAISNNNKFIVTCSYDKSIRL